MKSSVSRETLLRRILFLSLAFAVATAVASGVLYPGGTSRDPSTSGYSLATNYLSDLGMTVAYNGAHNVAGAALFFVSCACFGAAALLVGRRPAAASSGWPGRLTGAVGWGIAVLFLLTGLTPKNLLHHVHNAVSNGAFILLLLLWLCFLVGGLGGRVLAGRVVGSRVLGAVMAGFSLLYLVVLFSSPPIPLPEAWALQVVAQKAIVTITWLGLLVASMIHREATVSRETVR